MFRVGLFSIDQALSSLSNLAASIAAAHILSAGDFGAFGIVFATYLLVVLSARAVTGEVLLLADAGRANANGAINLVVAAVVGLGAGMILLGVAALLRGPVGVGLVPLAVGMVGLTVQDTIRYIGFATRRIELALVTDALWLAFIVLGFFFVSDSRSSLGEVTTIWVGSGVAAAFCTLPLLRTARPRWSAIAAWLCEQKNAMRNLLFDRGLVSVSQQSIIYVVALFIGLEGNAAYRGAQIVMAPINVLSVGLVTAVVPYLVRVWGRRPATLKKEAIRIAAISGFGLLGLTQLVANMPDWLGRAILAESWTYGQPVLHVMAMIIPLQAVNFTAANAMRAMGRTGAALAVRFVSVPMTLLAVVAAAYWGDIGAVIWAQVGTTAAAMLLWWSAFSRTYRHDCPPSANKADAAEQPELNADLS